VGWEILNLIFKNFRFLGKCLKSARGVPVSEQKPLRRHSRAGGNLGLSVRKLIGKTVSLDFTFWIPAFAGMTGCRFPYGWLRHSRAGGNLGLSVRKFIG
ncbi:hypothetical protein, partial [Neisseria meningitidis]|uniref:hypothetical protein n=2 Tax=Neisseria meningitidis TaxID=487 RepID=UPI001C86762E